MVRYCINDCRNSGRISVRCWIQKDTSYLALTGELWGVFCKYFGENWPRYNGTALYMFMFSLKNSAGKGLNICSYVYNVLIHPQPNGWHFENDSWECIFLKENVCILNKISCICPKISLNLKWVPNLWDQISQHWCRKWLDTRQATSHHLNQWWPSPLTKHMTWWSYDHCTIIIW